MKKILAIFSIIFLAGINQSQAQCDTIANVCHKNNFDINYISDGQNYRAFLFGDQEAEFETTLFAGTTYRIAACTGFTQGNLIFQVKDKDGNVLFDSMDHGNVPYWDFKVESTTTVLVTAKLDTLEAQSGCATILIGFKQ